MMCRLVLQILDARSGDGDWSKGRIRGFSVEVKIMWVRVHVQNMVYEAGYNKVYN